jgi:2-polyprenyl-3-methyl-5-hydroxy-6-metoxy-1,4-benzoquinol methylase
MSAGVELAVQQWDKEYAEGRYNGEPPLRFTQQIIEDVKTNHKDGLGLYVGCGNGRNYIPMLDNGLRVHGADISQNGLNEIIEKRPWAERRLATYDFKNSNAARIFDYIAAIQVFQHGTIEDVNQYFSKAYQALKPEGSLYLRVNSTATEMIYNFDLVEETKQKGATILYKEGPKTGQNIHFYTSEELLDLANFHGFEVTQPPIEITEQRNDSKKSTWTQLETIWRKVDK